MIYFQRFTRTAAVLMLLGGAQMAHSQVIVDWQPAGSGSWGTDDNWNGANGMNVPDGAGFDEIANISNGGTAIVDSSVASPGQLIIGQNVGDTGSVIIEDTRTLTVAASLNGTGGIAVGADGSGTLTVEAGGSLVGTSLVVGGQDVGSVLTVGGATGSASSIAISGDTTVSREVRVIGPNASFTTSNFNLFSTGVYIPQITSSSHSAIVASGNVFSDGGTLRPEFSGVTPSSGDTWDLFDAASFTGQFTVDASAAPALPAGQFYRFQTVDSGGSVLGQLAVEQLLVLNVDRGTGAVTIVNGPEAVSIDGYFIQSALGGLNPGAWNSLEDQGDSDWRESALGGSVNGIGELKPTGAKTITDASPISLGSAFQMPTPTEFGTELEDLTFEYYSAGGVVTQGVVNYTGVKQHNNLVLVVDPESGEARMENQSVLTANIDGYKIESESGSLLFANGQWNSLDDQDAAGGDWDESNPSDSLLAELKAASSTELTSGANFNLGELFKVMTAGGSEDLTFQYLFTGEDDFRDGVVVYSSLALSADFNEDTFVDGTDLGTWETAYGSSAGGDTDADSDSDGLDFLAWQRQYTGPASVSAISAVPEPSTLVLLMGVACPLALMARRKIG